MKRKILIFYPFFPTYRKKILEHLVLRDDLTINIAAGTQGRASIDALTASQIPQLIELETIRLGPVSIHKNAVGHATDDSYDAVILAPATLSISVWTILIARRVMGRETFLWGQCGEPETRNLKRFVQELMNRLSTGLLVYADAAKKAACELRTPPDKVFVIGNAVERDSGIQNWSKSQAIDIIRKKGVASATDNFPVRLLYVGRVTASKRLERLLEAIEILLDKGYQVSADIIGGGDALDELRVKIASRDLPVTAPGPLYTDADLEPYFERATIAIAPDAIGLLALDALRHCVPVVYPVNAVNGPEYESLTLGVNAVNFTNRTAIGVATAIEEWLALAPIVDVDEYERCTREAVEAWTPENVAARIVGTIESRICN